MPDIRDSFLMHQIYLSRYSTYEARKLIAILDNANSLIKQYVLKAKSIDTKARYERIAREIRRIMNEAVETLDRQLELDFIDLADEEIQFVEKTLSKFTVKAEFALPAPKKVWATASFGTYSGTDGKYTFKSYMDSLGDNAFGIWDIACRSAYLAGTPARDVVKSVMGTINTDGWEVGRVQKLRNSLEMNARTMVASLAETARDAVYRENEDIFRGYTYLATLDTRTCLICAADDGKLFKRLDEAPKLPRHLNDRCLYVPYLKGFEDIPGERAAVNGPVSDKLTYQDWFAQQSERMQREILGPTRYAAYKAGAPITSFVTDRRTLSIKELRALERIPEAITYPRVDKAKREVLQQQTNEYFDKLADTVKREIVGYTDYDYTNINNTLHGNIGMTNRVKEKIASIDVAISGFTIHENMTVFRGTNAAYYSDWEAGSIKKFDSYASTSVLKSMAKWFYKRQDKLGNEPIMLEIRVPAGTKGLYIGDKTGFKVNQAELLLNRGLPYKVIEKRFGYMLLEVVT